MSTRSLQLVPNFPLARKPWPSQEGLVIDPTALSGALVSPDKMLYLWADAWADLERNATEPNPYYGLSYAAALLDEPQIAGPVTFATVWSRQELVALLPVVLSGQHAPLAHIQARAWQTPYTYSCTPLLRSGREDEAAEALVDLLAQFMPGRWLIPSINLHQSSCGAFLGALSRRTAPAQVIDQFRRPALSTQSGFDDHMRRLKSSRRNDLARCMRRLSELGTVRHEVHTAEPGLSKALRKFLVIESSGWKGQRGTALACEPETERFALHAFSGKRNGKVRIDLLLLDEHPIAASIALMSGREAFTVKCAYREDYARYSPGLLLEVEFIRDVLTTKCVDWVDSAATENHVVGSLWGGERLVGDIIFSLAPRFAQLQHSYAVQAEMVRRSTRKKIKAWLGR